MTFQELFERWLSTKTWSNDDMYGHFIGWVEGLYDNFANEYLNLEYLDDERALDVSDNVFNAKELLFLFDYAISEDYL